MRLLDRYIIRSYLMNYVLSLGVLMGVVVLFDLIINFDKFTPKDPTGQMSGMAVFFRMMADMGDYYFYQSFLFFQLVSPVIPTLAAGFTMVRMTRHNELTAMLASGVSLYRIAAPIIILAILFSLLVIANQEVVIPHFAEKLLRTHDGSRETISRNDPLYFVKDNDNSLLIALQYNPEADPPTMKDVRIVFRDASGAPIGRIMATDAVWDENHIDKDNHLPVGGTWIFHNARQIDDKNTDPRTAIAETERTLERPYSSLTPRQLNFIYSKKAVDFLSSSQIAQLSQNSPEANRPAFQKIMNIRFTQPVMNIIMLLIGIPFLLTREPGRLIVNLFYCVIVSGICFVATFVFFQLSGSPPLQIAGMTLASSLFAWVPIVIFFPLSLVMLSGIKT